MDSERQGLDRRFTKTCRATSLVVVLQAHANSPDWFIVGCDKHRSHNSRFKAAAVTSDGHRRHDCSNIEFSEQVLRSKLQRYDAACQLKHAGLRSAQ